MDTHRLRPAAWSLQGAVPPETRPGTGPGVPCLQGQRSISQHCSQRGWTRLHPRGAHSPSCPLTGRARTSVAPENEEGPGTQPRKQPVSTPVLGRPGMPVLGHGSDTRWRCPMARWGRALCAPPGRGGKEASTRERPPRLHGRWLCLCPRLAAPSLAGARGPGLEEARAAHSSLCRGRHWGEGLSSRTPSGAHTQGSCVSHCHLASWARSSSSAGA